MINQPRPPESSSRGETIPPASEFTDIKTYFPKHANELFGARNGIGGVASASASGYDDVDRLDAFRWCWIKRHVVSDTLNVKEEDKASEQIVQSNESKLFY